MELNRHRFLEAVIATLQGPRKRKLVVVAYAEAGSEKQAAIRTGVAYDTARSHMRRMYRANGVHSLLDLVILGAMRYFVTTERTPEDATARRRQGDDAVPRSPARTPTAGR